MSRYINREQSWLAFNARVLDLAADTSLPLLERVKFCAIFSGNLDEFFEVRVAGLSEQFDAGVDTLSIDGQTAAQQLDGIADTVDELVARQSAIFLAQLSPELATERIEITAWSDLSDEERKSLVSFYDEHIFPVLTPLSVDPGHPFPYISNLSLNLAAMVREPTTGERRFTRVKVPPLLPRFLRVPIADQKLVPIEQVIAAQMSSLFPGMHIESAYTFRVTRNADLDLEEEEAEDLLAAVEMELRRRRFGRAVRLEVESGLPTEALQLLMDELELELSNVTMVDGLLDLTGLWSIYDLDRPDLKDEPFSPRVPAELAGVDGEEPCMFDLISTRDLLVHHPYDSFEASVERFIRQAAADPDVLTIKLTLYRTSGDSPVVRALIDAAERGKQVAVLIELKARFDEQANIQWARALEEAGVHVVYGLLGLKTHTKVALVVRSEHGGLRRYCHLATGNYNSATARLYEDIGLFTAAPEMGDDLTRLFNYLTGYSQPVKFQRLMVAPAALRDSMVELIRNEHHGQHGGAPGRIIMKMNSLVDQAIIDALYDASDAGVSIDLIVRGICCLRPGVAGLSENIRVRSIVGRFLEHSRVFYFANAYGPGEPGWFIGSADMMPRNLDRRIEAVVPVDHSSLTTRLESIVETLLADNVMTWVLSGDGRWSRPTVAAGEPRLVAQEAFLALPGERSR